ncbi:MAG: DUF4019 domain-containing protein [Phycisphaerales bacterium]|nr:MAG: DUF4019 domain-containing protein [Phycisphaerales bacterium]
MTEASTPPVTESRPLDYSASPPPRKPRAKRWLAFGFGGVLLLVVICGGGFAWLILGGKAEVEPIVEDFLARLEKQDYSGAYNRLGTEWKSIDTLEAFTKLEKRMREVTGPLQSRELEGFNIQRATGGSIAVCTYTGQFANGAGSITITLTDSSGSWKVVGHRIDSPLFIQVLTCPHCGAVSQSLADYCPSCGKPMRPDAESSPHQTESEQAAQD